MLSKYITQFTEEFTKEYDKRMFEILDNYFGEIPRDFDKLGKWIQEKRNQGYNITHGQDMNCIFQTQGKQVQYLTIQYNGETVLKEVVLALDINTIFKEVTK